jgi:hypothetical protein
MDRFICPPVHRSFFTLIIIRDNLTHVLHILYTCHYAHLHKLDLTITYTNYTLKDLDMSTQPSKGSFSPIRRSCRDGNKDEHVLFVSVT